VGLFLLNYLVVDFDYGSFGEEADCKLKCLVSGRRDMIPRI
jgi:hypothetical protein